MKEQKLKIFKRIKGKPGFVLILNEVAYNTRNLLNPCVLGVSTALISKTFNEFHQEIFTFNVSFDKITDKNYSHILNVINNNHPEFLI